MSSYISENIISENGLTGGTLVSDIIYANSVSATTFYGDGTNITNISIIDSNITDNSILYRLGDDDLTAVLTGSTNLALGGKGAQANVIQYTGGTKFDGLFYLTNSASGKLKVQWFGAIQTGGSPGIIWANMPTLTTTWLHQSSGTLTADATYIVDLTEYTEYRFFFSKQVAGTATSSLSVQYSFDNITWQLTTLATLPIGIVTGVSDSTWLPILPNARTFIYIRLVGTGGNGTADPRFSPPIILFR